MDNRSEMLQLCRLCLVKDDVNIPIFEEQGDIRKIFLKISSCLPVKVSREDKLPKKICDGCSYKLDMLYEFWNTTANAEKQLLSWLGEAGMNSKMTDDTISAVAQQIKPTETFVKQEAIDPSDIHTEVNDDDKSYMFQQKFTVEEAGPSATVTSNEEEPPPKRARRTAAVKAQIAMDPESDDDDDSGEPMTKMEDESEDSDGEDREPTFVDVPSTSADDQPGPSGVGKDGVEAPCNQVNNGEKSVVSTKKRRPSKSLKGTKRKRRQLECYTLEKFINLNELKTPLKCSFCTLSFEANVDFALHSKIHSDNGEYSCHLCDYKKYNKQSIMRHLKAHDVFQCEICKKIFKRKSNAFKHSKMHATRKRVPCDKCDKEFSSLRNLKVHRERVHQDGKPFSYYICTICKKEYKSISSLRKHCSYNHKELGIDMSGICEICGKRISAKSRLPIHLKTHMKNKPFACSVCSKTFATKFILNIHMVKHTGEKPYVCKFCDKRYGHDSAYRYHLKTHSGDRPYTCQFCAKGFISNANKKIHVQSCCKK